MLEVSAFAKMKTITTLAILSVTVLAYFRVLLLSVHCFPFSSPGKDGDQQGAFSRLVPAFSLLPGQDDRRIDSNPSYPNSVCHYCILGRKT